MAWTPRCEQSMIVWVRGEYNPLDTHSSCGHCIAVRIQVLSVNRQNYYSRSAHNPIQAEFLIDFGISSAVTGYTPAVTPAGPKQRVWSSAVKRVTSDRAGKPYIMPFRGTAGGRYENIDRPTSRLRLFIREGKLDRNQSRQVLPCLIPLIIIRITIAILD